MEILVIDGQGGGMGRGIVDEVRRCFPQARIRAVGTNSIATGNMRKAGADISATGENAVVVGARNADYILGPIGIVIADALYGEIPRHGLSRESEPGKADFDSREPLR